MKNSAASWSPGAVIWKVALVAAVAVNLYSMYAPRVPGPSSSLRLDLVGHAVSFAALTLTGLMAGARARWWIPVVALNALASELIQGFLLPNRSGDGVDLMADAVGITLGWLVARWLAARWQSLTARSRGPHADGA